MTKFLVQFTLSGVDATRWHLFYKFSSLETSNSALSVIHLTGSKILLPDVNYDQIRSCQHLSNLIFKLDNKKNYFCGSSANSGNAGNLLLLNKKSFFLCSISDLVTIKAKLKKRHEIWVQKFWNVFAVHHPQNVLLLVQLPTIIPLRITRRQFCHSVVFHRFQWSLIKFKAAYQVCCEVSYSSPSLLWILTHEKTITE